MKKSSLTIFMVFATIFAFTQNLINEPKVDERAELLSIAFRLANITEYVNNDINNYSSKIDSCFDKYKNDDLIKFIKTIRKKQGVAYDAVMSMAIHLEINNETIKLKDDVKENSIDNRWGNKPAEFVKYLNDFYSKSNFHDFFLKNSGLYSESEKRFKKILSSVDFNWFGKFYGELPRGNFIIILSMVNGGKNYGSDISFKNGNRDIYAFMGVNNIDSLGLPVYSKYTVETIIHEFNHSFCNNLIDSNYSQMAEMGDKFFNLVSDKMKEQAYGSTKFMLCEMLVRACVIKYYQANDTSKMKIKRMISTEQANGFIWIDTLVNALSYYENARSLYPTLEKFMPEIVKIQNSLEPERILKKTEENRPQIVSFSITNNNNNVDPNTKKLILTFDRPMFTRPYGMSYGKRGKNYYPQITSVKWDLVKKNELIISLELIPNKEYSISFPAPFMLDENGFVMKETYYLDFKTRKK